MGLLMSDATLKIFISYSRQDSAFARRLTNSLTRQGADVWIDTDDIPAGIKWSEAVQRGLDTCTAMVLIVSPDAMESSNVADEWQYYHEQRKPIIPVLCRPTTIRHFQLNRIQYVDFVTQGYNDAYRQLGERLFEDDESGDSARKRAPEPLTTGNTRRIVSRKTLKSHKDSVRGVAISPDSALLVTGSDDRTVRLWHTTGRRSSRIKGIGHEKAVNTVAFNPTGTFFASGSDDRTVRVWHVEKSICITALIGHGGPVTGLAFSPAEALLASSGEDGTIRLWDVRKQAPAGTLGAHEGPATDVAFSPDGALLASGGSDQRVRLWAMTDPAERREVAAIEVDDSVYRIAFSPDGTLIVVGLYSAGLAIIDVGKQAVVETVTYADFNANCVRGVAFSPDGALLASGTLDGKIRLWNAQKLSDGRKSRALRALDEHDAGITGLAFSPDGTLLASGSHDSTVRLWGVRK